jgi:hypothetical protein
LDNMVNTPHATKSCTLKWLTLWDGKRLDTGYSISTKYSGPHSFTFCVLFFVFLVGLEFDSGLRSCKAGTLLLEPHLRSILVWLFWRGGLANYFPPWP